MSKFKTPLAIEGTKEQLLALVPRLEELGYVKGSKGDMRYEIGYLLMTHFQEDCTIGFFCPVNVYTKVLASNPDLVLALAAMREGDEFYKGEAVMMREYKSNGSVWPYDANKENFFIVKNPKYSTDYVLVESWKDHNNPNTYPSKFRKATKEEIIKHFTMKEEKKIIGYKFKPEFEKFSDTVLNLLGAEYFTQEPPITSQRSITILQEAKLLDLWFEPIYEDTDKKKVFTLQCKGGSFEIEVSTKGIYYAPDKTFLDVNDLRIVCNQGHKVSKIGMSNYYSFSPSHLDSGCKKEVPIENWVAVLDYYNSIIPF